MYDKPLRLFCSSYPMAKEYGYELDTYFDHLAAGWEDECYLISAGQAFKDSGNKFGKGYLDYVCGCPEGYDAFRFQEFVVPVETTVIDAFMEVDDPRRENPNFDGIHQPGETEDGRRYIRVGGVTAQIITQALATDRPVFVVGNGFSRTYKVVYVKHDTETYLTARGNQRTLDVAMLFVDDEE